MLRDQVQQREALLKYIFPVNCVNDADHVVYTDIHLYTPVTATEVTVYNSRIINPPPFITQKRLQSYFYPADRITHFVSARSYTGANKQTVIELSLSCRIDCAPSWLVYTCCRHVISRTARLY